MRQVTVGKRGGGVNAIWARHLFYCLSLWTGGWGGGVMHYKAISKLKSCLLLFIYFFIFCQKLHRAAEDHSKLASICHDEGPGTFALRCPQHPHSPPSSLHPTPLHWDFLLCIAKLPISTCMIIEHSDLHTGESSSSSFGRRKVSALESGMKSEWSCCLSALKPSAVEYFFMSFVLTMPMCLNLTLWTFPHCNSVHCKDGINIGVEEFKRKYMLFIPYIIPSVQFLFKELFSSLYFLWQDPRS